MTLQLYHCKCTLAQPGHKRIEYNTPTLNLQNNSIGKIGKLMRTISLLQLDVLTDAKLHDSEFEHRIGPMPFRAVTRGFTCCPAET